jgi:fatty acid desaturase
VQVVAVVMSQFVMARLVRDWAWWQVWLAAYVISGTLNQNLFCAQHEISHFLAFRKPLHNKLLALFGNLPLVVPVAVKFREYHHDHHIFLGVDGGDVDLPTVLESRFITGFFSKLFFTFVYLGIYAIRPLVVRPKAASEAPPAASRACVLAVGPAACMSGLWGGACAGTHTPVPRPAPERPPPVQPWPTLRTGCWCWAWMPACSTSGASSPWSTCWPARCWAAACTPWPVT